MKERSFFEKHKRLLRKLESELAVQSVDFSRAFHGERPGTHYSIHEYLDYVEGMIRDHLSMNYAST